MTSVPIRDTQKRNPQEERREGHVTGIRVVWSQDVERLEPSEVGRGQEGIFLRDFGGEVTLPTP